MLVLVFSRLHTQGTRCKEFVNLFCKNVFCYFQCTLLPIFCQWAFPACREYIIPLRRTACRRAKRESNSVQPHSRFALIPLHRFGAALQLVCGSWASCFGAWQVWEWDRLQAHRISALGAACPVAMRMVCIVMA